MNYNKAYPIPVTEKPLRLVIGWIYSFVRSSSTNELSRLPERTWNVTSLTRWNSLSPPWFNVNILWPRYSNGFHRINNGTLAGQCSRNSVECSAHCTMRWEALEWTRAWLDGMIHFVGWLLFFSVTGVPVLASIVSATVCPQIRIFLVYSLNRYLGKPTAAPTSENLQLLPPFFYPTIILPLNRS